MPTEKHKITIEARNKNMTMEELHALAFPASLALATQPGNVPLASAGRKLVTYYVAQHGAPPDGSPINGLDLQTSEILGQELVQTGDGVPRQFEYDDEPIRPCKSCQTDIYFVKSATTGRPIPVNYKTGQAHFADCPGAKRHRRNRNR